MPRSKKNIEDAARLADELIAANAKLKEDKADDEPAPEPELDEPAPVDDSLDLPPEDQGTEDFDLSSLDDEPPPADDKDLAHKFSVLQGKYNSETKRLSDLLSQTMGEVQGLKDQLRSAPAPAPELADLSNDGDISPLKDQFPALYNSFLALARKEAKSEVARATKGTSDKVDAIVQQTEVDKRDVYFSRLGEAVPVWEKINTHPSFLKWLAEPDEFSGTTRKNLLTAAHNRMDYATTAKFFNAFIKEKGIKVKGKSDDSDNIAPDTSGAHVSRNARTQAGTMTRSEIAKFYQDKAQGRLTGTAAEIAKQEARIFQFVREGKVRPG